MEALQGGLYRAVLNSLEKYIGILIMIIVIYDYLIVSFQFQFKSQNLKEISVLRAATDEAPKKSDFNFN